VLLSGDVLGDIKLMGAEEMEFAMDAECTTCVSLLRVELTALRLHGTCDVLVKGKPAAQTSTSATGIMAHRSHCRVCQRDQGLSFHTHM
jgi:hypothetical protein